MTRRIYEELRTIIEKKGGTMEHFLEGAPQGGKWAVTLQGNTREFLSNGAGFPELDRLYKPLVDDPKHWRDYSNDLIPDAESKLLAMISE